MYNYYLHTLGTEDCLKIHQIAVEFDTILYF